MILGHRIQRGDPGATGESRPEGTLQIHKQREAEMGEHQHLHVMSHRGSN